MSEVTTVAFTVRVPRLLLRDFDKVADSQERTRTGELLTIMRAHVDAHKGKGVGK